MEKLAWVEILDRHGDVAARHPVQAWPLRLGRAYDSDIVLDDPYIAPHHLEVTQTENGSYQLLGLQSINGVMINNLLCKKADAIVSSNDVLRLGHTQLRIRPLDFAVAAEKPLTTVVWSRSWTGMIFGFAILLSAHLLSLWLEYSRDDSYKLLVSPMLSDIPLLLLWAGFWALIGRVLSGSGNFIAHTVLAAVVVAVVFVLAGILAGYIDFAFNTRLVNDVILNIIQTVVIGWLFYRHIGLVSRASRRKIGITITVLMAGLVGIFYGIDKWNSDDDLTRMSYSQVIGPPAVMLVQGKSIEQFMEDAGKLKMKLKVDEKE
jgi:hypothetical protein